MAGDEDHRPVGQPDETSPLIASRHPNHEDTAQDNEHGSPDLGPSAAKVKLLLPTVGIGMFMVALDQLFIVSSYAKIGSNLQALNNTSWIATSYFLTLTIFQPLYGRLSDIFGRKPCLLFAYTAFGLGCLSCGVARNIVQLCLARAVAGVGGGGVNAVVSILISDFVPLRERGLYQGYINVIWGAGTSLGAPVGGFLADSIGWRWSFIIQVPICVVAWILVYALLDTPGASHLDWLQKIRRVDFLGASTLATAVIALLSGLDAGSNLGWSHLRSIIPLSLTPALFAAFLFIETRIAEHAFAPGHIIFNPALFACYLTNFCGMAGQMAMFFFIPLYLQACQQRSAAESGILMTPATVAVILASIGGGWLINRTGKFYKATVSTFGLLLFSTLPLTLSVWYDSTLGLVAGLVFATFGIGTSITTTLIGLLANVATEDSAVTIACSYLFRSLGASVGISITSAVQQQVIRSQLRIRLGSDGNEASQIEERVRQSLDYINELPPDIADTVRSAYRLGTLGAFGPTTLLLAAAFVSSFWVKEKALRR